ncbi:DNA polymerase III subunit beta [Acrocarpospora catenulata]|uniref:DNA polymerase III subunit beta n=1 Tax=Acrocarpospora catenulata TaxID=2836182 RepID=UPI001BDAEC8C|nr:DNA polymerase III subunit beta [Acrocarpospora catenulata]
MKVQVNRDVLAEAVAWAARVIPGRPALPVLSGLLLEAGEEELRVAAFDYDVSARAEIEAEVAEPGRVLLPGRVLAEIVKSLPGRPVEIVTTGAEAVLTCGTAEFGLLTLPVEDFPTLPQMPPRLGAIGGGVFATSVAQVAVAASRDDTLPMLTGVRLDIDGLHVSMAATDRYRIAARDLLWIPESDTVARAVVVPARVLVDVAKALRGGEVAVGLGGNLAGFESQGRSTTVRLLDDQFIDYRSRLTGDWPIQATVPVAPFADAIRRVTLVAERSTAAVRLSFTEGEVLIQAGGGEIGRGAEVVEAELAGQEIVIAFQPQFLLDGLAGVQSERVRIAMDSPSRPALITEDGEDPAFRYLVMSLRLP